MSFQIEVPTAKLVVVVSRTCPACKKFMKDYRADLKELRMDGLLVMQGPGDVEGAREYPSFLVERNGDREFIDEDIREAEPGEMASHVRRKYLGLSPTEGERPRPRGSTSS